MTEPTYHGQPLNQGTLTPRAIHDGEGYAELRCGGTRVRLSYTVLHALSSLIDLRGYRGDFQAMAETIKALHAVTGEAAEGRIPMDEALR
jgi:hypothetical protein